jgi:ADP-ribosylglycohydrolase
MKVVPVVGRYAGCPELLDKVTTAVMVHQNNQKAVAFAIASARLLEAVILGAPLEEALETVQKNVADDLASSEFKDDVLKAFARGKRGGKEEAKTLDDVLLEISHEAMEGKEDSPFYDLAGRSCALPGSFIGPIALFYKYASFPQSFATALRENILASGDTCSRSVFVGAIFAAVTVGDSGDASWSEGIPADWIEKFDAPTMKKLDAALSSIAA